MNRSRCTTILSLMALGLLGAADGPNSVPSDPTFTALRVDGSTISGRLLRIDTKLGISLAVDAAERAQAVASAELVKLTREGGLPYVPNDGGVVLFPEGDRLHRAVFGPAGETSVEVQSFALGTLGLPLDAVLGIVFAPPLDPIAAQSLIARVRDEPRAGEVLWLANGDRMVGGLLGIDEKSIEFQPAAGKIKIDRTDILALGFDPKVVAYPRPSGPFLEITLVDGTRLGVSSISLEGSRLQAMTRYGQEIKIPLAELSQVHTRNGPVEYLSDRAPTIEKYVAYLGPTRPVRRNQAVDGSPLQLAGKSYDRGLGTQSRSMLAYRLEPGVKRFQALVGVDDRAGPLGSVVFRVIVDGEERFVSSPMSVRDTAKTIDVDLTSAKSLVLITEFGERGEVRDHADWVEARLIR